MSHSWLCQKLSKSKKFHVGQLVQAQKITYFNNMNNRNIGKECKNYFLFFSSQWTLILILDDVPLKKHNLDIKQGNTEKEVKLNLHYNIRLCMYARSKINYLLGQALIKTPKAIFLNLRCSGHRTSISNLYSDIWLSPMPHLAIVSFIITKIETESLLPL